MNTRAKQVALALAAIFAACCSCVALSLLLVRIPWLQTQDSSNAGQALGAASAVSSTAVLIYMAGAIRVQMREVEFHRDALRTQQESLQEQCEVSGLTNGELHRTSEALMRGIHISILKMAVDDPELAVTWPLYSSGGSELEHKQYLYMNQVLSMHFLFYETAYTAAHVEASLQYLFTNPLWREFWESLRVARSREIPPDTVEAAFSEMVERAYQAALLATPLRRNG
ncbi:DUF6082 family protein [Streptomyces sp. TLI_146]|uniref:DUF6082 family protein n=1 Tax=Streptomyces sp. TLI_146 TaxID=1938858 RepID=UPI000CAC092A|nr:DUF6082 family protein [Streptomyces sp. TLI_146]PKV85898.1 hypothetical protein BX283_3447 [Streptomyces sp. TLI_146]